MPAAGPFEPYVQDEFVLARQYVLEHLSEMTQQDVKPTEDQRTVLVDGVPGVVYPFAPTREEEADILFSPQFDVLLHLPWATQIHLLDVRRSQLTTVSREQLIAIICNQDHGGIFGVRTMMTDWGWGRVLIPVEGLVRRNGHKTVDLSASPYLKYRSRSLRATEDFVHLHTHSMYSLLDGVMSPTQIAERVYDLGQPGVALTDHGFMFGIWRHAEACREVGVKPLHGVECYLVDDVNERYRRADGTEARFEYHQTLIAMNDTGWRNLCEMMSIAGRDHYHYVPRIDHQMLFEHNEGLICLSGCFKGPVAHYLQHRQPRPNEELPPWLKRDPDRSRSIMRQYREHFGGRYYAEVMNINFPPYTRIVPEIIQMAEEEGVPVVATNDCHYERTEDAVIQALSAKVGGYSVGDGVGGVSEPGEYYLKSRSEIEGGMFTGAMCDRTCEIMDRCDLEVRFDGYLFPTYDVTHDNDWTQYAKAKGLEHGVFQ